MPVAAAEPNDKTKPASMSAPRTTKPYSNGLVDHVIGSSRVGTPYTRSGISTYCTPTSAGSSTSVGLAGSANLKWAVSPVIWPATSSR